MVETADARVSSFVYPDSIRWILSNLAYDESGIFTGPDRVEAFSTIKEMTVSVDIVRAMAAPELSQRSYTAIDEHLYSELGDEAVILNLTNGKYYGINPVGVTIWKTIRTAASLSDIEAAIMSEFDVDAETCREESLRFLEKMVEEQLVKVDG